MNMKKKITLKYYGHRYPEQLLMRAANMISAVTPTDGLTIRTSTKSATIYADPIQARAIAKQIKKSTGVTVIVNLPDNVGRFIDFLVATADRPAMNFVKAFPPNYSYIILSDRMLEYINSLYNNNK